MQPRESIHPAREVIRNPFRAWSIALLLAAGVFVNYLDRVNLSVAYGALKHDWGLTDFGFGLLSSAYSWTYTALQLPMGWLLDTVGVYATGTVAALLWSVASLGAAGAPGLRSFVSARLLLGVAEAPTFPANAKAIGQWFPRSRRGTPTGMFDAAAKLGTAAGVPLLGLLLLRHGWRWSFGFTGAISFLYFLVFALVYRNPRVQSAASDDAASVDITSVRQSTAPATARDTSTVALLRNRNVLGLTLGFSGYGYSFYLFLTWLPEFLTRSLGMPLLQSATATALPWTLAACSSFAIGGLLVDALVARGANPTRVRKTILCTGLLLGLVSFGATQTHSPVVAIACITIALSGLAASASVGWQVPALIAPAGAEARVSSIMNFANNLMAICAPVVTGALVQRTHSFVLPFAVAGAMLIVGIAGYTFLLGEMEPPAATETATL